MKLTALLERLRRSGHPFAYSGPDYNDIYGAALLTPSCFPRPDMLYLASSHGPPSEKAARKGTFAGELSILTPGQGEDPERLLFLLQDWLADDLRRRELLSQLTQAVARKCGIYAVARQCSQILGAPVLLLNHALEPLCQYPETGLEAEQLAALTRQIEVWRLAGGDTAAQQPSSCLLGQFFYEEEDYCLCGLWEDSASDRALAEEGMRQICEIFDADTRAGWKEEQLEILITGLLLRRFSFTEQERERLAALGWQFWDKYYVLAIERTSPASDGALYNEVRTLLNMELYQLGKYWVAIPHSELRVEYTEQNFRRLDRLLKEHQLLATLSMGFFALADCAAAFEQCRACMEFAHEHDHIGIHYCGRYQITHLLRTLDPHHQLDLKLFCSPVILLIYEYDKTHGTNYLGTLFAYICSGQSTKHSAAVLNLHVNTMYMRVNWLRDEFNIDFSDPHMLYTLRNSIVLLNLYDKDSLAPGMGWPFLEN